MAKLTFVLEDGQEVVIPLEGRIRVGRGDGNDVVVDDERISPNHAELSFDADGLIEVRDLDSTAGTFVNDRSVQSQIIGRGDTLAFGPLTARLDFEISAAARVAEAIRGQENRLAQFQAAVDEAAAAHGKWITAIQELSRQHDEKSVALEKLASVKSTAQKEIENLATRQAQDRSRLEQLRSECDQEGQRLGDLRRQLTEVEKRTIDGKTRADTLEAQVRIAGKKLEQLGNEQQQVQESLIRIQAELAARKGDLAEIEAKCAAFATTEKQLNEMRAILAATERREAEVKAALQKAEERLAAQNSALHKANAAEAAVEARIEDLTAREKALRAELQTSGPAIEKAGSELAGIESRLTPLRDWKKSMDQRYARLNTLAKGSADESSLWREIEAAQAALFDLLPAAQIKTPGLTRVDFTRISKLAGVPMKSDRISRAAS